MTYVEQRGETERLMKIIDRIEAENLAFRIGHLTASFEHIAQQAEELRLRRAKAWAGACQPAFAQDGLPAVAQP